VVVYLKPEHDIYAGKKQSTVIHKRAMCICFEGCCCDITSFHMWRALGKCFLSLKSSCSSSTRNEENIKNDKIKEILGS